MKAPKAKKIPHSLLQHKHERNDPYFWMNERDSPAVLNYIHEENAFASIFFKSLKPLHNNLLKEYNERINPNEVSAAVLSNGNWYRRRSEANKNYPLHEIQAGSKWEVFIDENVQAAQSNFYQLASFSTSDDNCYLVLNEDYTGRRKYEISILSNQSKTRIENPIPNTGGYVVWDTNSTGFYYIKKDEQTLREFQVYYHLLGTDYQQDKLIFEELDERYYVSIHASISRKFLIIGCESSTTSESVLIDLKTQKQHIFWPRKKGHIYQVEHHEKGFYVLSNEKAKNNKLLFSNSLPQAIHTCLEIIPHQKEQLIEDFVVLKKFVSVLERKNGSQSIRIIDIDSNKHNFLSMNEEVYCLQFSHNATYDSDDLYFSYNSLTTPPSIFGYNFQSKKQRLHYQKELLDKKFTPNNYATKRIEATATDGVKIPISLVYKKGVDTSNAPLLLYGYGSYGITVDPNFSPYRLTLLDRGFVFAIAHIRGGKFLGENWYRNGKFKRKMNTFLDFIQCAKAMAQQGYASPEKVYAMGGSAGGLLMGACMNLAPFLFKGVVAQVPFVDVLTTMLDESIPLTVGEYEEWGNPNKKDYYDYMLQYSPYDNIQKTAYPSLLITTGYHDSQVQYWEPLKWVAKLRDYKTDNNPLVFECTMDAGHGGGSGRQKEREEVAKIHSFLLHLEGITK